MTKLDNIFISVGVAFLIIGAAMPAGAQRRTRKSTTKKVQPPAASQTKAVAQPTPAPPKRNERPEGSTPLSVQNHPVDTTITAAARSATPTYRYEFSQPDFVIPKITIEHDETGVGTISFSKKGENEPITDPIRLSTKAMSRINDALSALNFLESTDNYQYEKDFSHLGNMKFGRSIDGRRREVFFNYTSNKDAKALMDEYRKIGNQFIWVFDITLSRENQPLEAPRLFDSLDSMIHRNEISDPHQMEPFLRELSNDERIPLIARNHAARLIKQFEKEKAKEEKKKSQMLLSEPPAVAGGLTPVIDGPL